jgi:hypothetical protein
MPLQQPTPLSALDALEQHTPRRVVHETLRAVTSAVSDEEIARWEDDGAPCRPESILQLALELAISERIGEHVDQGTEDLARRFYGDGAVDDWFRSIGWDPEAGRTEMAA